LQTWHKLGILKENIIFGLWFGEAKPNLNVFLKPIIAELMALENHGVEVKPPIYSSSSITKVILLAGTCDLPAKA